MKKSSTEKGSFESDVGSAFSFTSRKDKRNAHISDERIDGILNQAKELLNEGLSGAAVKILLDTHAKYDIGNKNKFTRLVALLSYAFETLGDYDESLNILQVYENESEIDDLDIDTKLRILTQLGTALNNKADHPKAVAVLNRALEEADKAEKNSHLGDIYVSMARVYRKLNEYPIARDFAEKAIKYHRQHGNWFGIAESYQIEALCFQHEGDLEKAVKNYQIAINIVGDRSAPFLLGKIYSDLAGAFWFLRKPQEGIKHLEKSIEFFEKTEHKVQSVAAYNNLGINLMSLGEWEKAEEVIKKSLELAIEVDHAHISGIHDSLGELKLLKGDYEAAENYFKKGVEVAEEKHSKWYKIQNLRNLARTFLAKDDLESAVEIAQETLELCETGEQVIANAARLVLAETFLKKGNFEQCDKELSAIEATDPRDDFYVLGNIQRIRGESAIVRNDKSLAEHHFKRALTIFETAEDLFHTALSHLLIGRTIGKNSDDALRHLKTASELFQKLGVTYLFEQSEQLLGELKNNASDNEKPVKTSNNAGSQLLLVRLAEATASRELLFRELVAVLQQESRAKRILVAEYNDQKKLLPFISHGFIPAESMELVNKLQEAIQKNSVKELSQTKNVEIYELKTPNAPQAFLLVYPRSGAVLNDGESLQPLLRVVQLGMDVCALRDRENPHLREDEIESPYLSQSLLPGFIHSSPAMTSLVEEVYKIRSSDVTVLVTGESGTGKELVSRAIHTVSTRKDKIFVPFNCTAVPKELAEGHLFGYRKGAFTGAINESPGLIRAADGGTLFLDEIGDLPIEVQPKLLRFLQEGEVQPIGEKKPLKVDVRVIAATNLPLEQKVEEGRFREDLYYRLNVIRLRVPPLRERRSEIPPMVNYYINHYSSRFGKSDISITPQAVDLLMVAEWEGNVRQLCNEIQRLIARAVNGEIITPEHLSADLRKNALPISTEIRGENVTALNSLSGSFFNFGKKGITIEEAVSELEIRMISDALQRHDWNISRTAKELGITRRGLYMKIERYNINKAA